MTRNSWTFSWMKVEMKSKCEIWPNHKQAESTNWRELTVYEIYSDTGGCCCVTQWWCRSTVVAVGCQRGHSPCLCVRGGGFSRRSAACFPRARPSHSVPRPHCFPLHSSVIFSSSNRSFVASLTPLWHFGAPCCQGPKWDLTGLWATGEAQSTMFPSLHWSHCGRRQCTNWWWQLSEANTQVQFSLSSIQITDKWVRPNTHTHTHLSFTL